MLLYLEKNKYLETGSKVIDVMFKTNIMLKN